MKVSTCGIDLAKNVFAVHGVDIHGCIDPLKTRSGDNHERESHEHDDGRRIQAVDSQAQGCAGYRNQLGFCDPSENT